MTKQQAEYLAARLCDDGDYVARKLGGRWKVWSVAADHVVEVDPETIAGLIGHPLDCRCRICSFSPLYIQD